MLILNFLHLLQIEKVTYINNYVIYYHSREAMIS